MVTQRVQCSTCFEIFPSWLDLIGHRKAYHSSSGHGGGSIALGTVSRRSVVQRRVALVEKNKFRDDQSRKVRTVLALSELSPSEIKIMGFDPVQISKMRSKIT